MQFQKVRHSVLKKVYVDSWPRCYSTHTWRQIKYYHPAEIQRVSPEHLHTTVHDATGFHSWAHLFQTASQGECPHLDFQVYSACHTEASQGTAVEVFTEAHWKHFRHCHGTTTSSLSKYVMVRCSAGSSQRLTPFSATLRHPGRYL